MGEPVKIKDLAENLIRLSGFVPNEDIKIEYVGMRPGEKLFEELLISDENCQITENNKIYVENPMNLDADFFRKNMELLKVASQRNDSNEIRKILVNFVGLREKH